MFRRETAGLQEASCDVPALGMGPLDHELSCETLLGIARAFAGPGSQEGTAESAAAGFLAK